MMMTGVPRTYSMLLFIRSGSVQANGGDSPSGQLPRYDLSSQPRTCVLGANAHMQAACTLEVSATTS
jgi:hypothetical protein